MGIFEEENYSQIGPAAVFKSWRLTNRFIFIYVDYTSQYINIFYADYTVLVCKVQKHHTVHVTTREIMLFHVYVYSTFI